MKIIQAGDPRKIKKTKTFVCRECGCKYEADKDEYKMIPKDKDGDPGVSVEVIGDCSQKEIDALLKSLSNLFGYDLMEYVNTSNGGKVTKALCDCPDCGGKLTGEEVL